MHLPTTRIDVENDPAVRHGHAPWAVPSPVTQLLIAVASLLRE
jgi:hypothetical protein